MKKLLVAMVALALMTATSNAQEFCMCRALAEKLVGHSLWGPSGWSCGGFAAWGPYFEECVTPDKIARCTAPPTSTVRNVSFWGPYGKTCNNQRIDQGWGQYIDLDRSAGVPIGTCKGQGTVEGVTLWGPLGEPCGGFAQWGTYH